MTLSAIAKRYADALADVVGSAQSTLAPQDAAAELRAFDAALQASPELREVFATPAVPLSRKRAVVGRIADLLRLSRITRNLLFILVDRRRIAALPEIVHRFELTVNERLGFARADVTAPRELSAAQRAGLSAALERLTGKRIRARFAIDEALIGGAVARIGSTIYDGSVRGELQSLERRLGAET